MGFTSFTGRLLFASFFLFSAWQEFNEFGVDGGPIATVFRSKIRLVTPRMGTYLGMPLSAIEIKHMIAALIALKGIGGVLFILGSSLGAYLLLLHQAISTPTLYDFYNYDLDRPEFFELLLKFAQGMGLFGALLFFLGMRNSIPRRQSKKKVPKSKRK